jgi:hypothetical protein
MRTIGAKNIHLLKLPDHRGSKSSDGCSNSRNYRIEFSQALRLIEQLRITFRYINRESKRIEDFDIVISRLARFNQPSRAITARLA